MGRAGSNARQRDFVKIYNSLCSRHNRHQVWQDFVYMIAAAISNAVDKRYAQEREEQYMSIVRKYEAADRNMFPQLFALVVAGMDEMPDQDFLGELYMQLELGNSQAGQFFTPYDLCKAMAMISIDFDLIENELRQNGYVSVNDCACGAGATLIAAAMVMQEKGINYQREAIFVAQDIDYVTGLMCYIQLSLLGCAGYVRIGDTLTDPMTGSILIGDGKSSTWYTPMYFHDVWRVRRTMKSALSCVTAVLPGDPASGAEIPMTRKGKPVEEPLQQATEPAIIAQDKGQMMFDFDL